MGNELFTFTILLKHVEKDGKENLIYETNSLAYPNITGNIIDDSKIAIFFQNFVSNKAVYGDLLVRADENIRSFIKEKGWFSK